MNGLIQELPQHLQERTRVIRDTAVNRSGQFVLYWMHHAVRAHENPALDVALEIGNRHKAPVLVYQGLGGYHRYNSDRHHTFALEGARDIQQQLRQQWIAYALRLSGKPGQRSPLDALAGRALLVVVEEFPVPPLQLWTERLAGRVNVPVWAVDCQCLIPMQCHGQRYERAYQFRNRTQSEFLRRVQDVWPQVRPQVAPFKGNLGFGPLDVEKADIAECCANCEIDHTVGPVRETKGGSEAGYTRWNQFKKAGLAEYAEYRNDPTIAPPRGVSRLSPYLHYGYVAPFRVAREAAEQGAEKFLDELLIWRELAHNLCFYAANVETIEVLPSWARQTLQAHECDRRDAIYSWERLAQGQTGDPLWDIAQKSLLIHGELHNNLRMTWGKALLSWTRSPQEALRLMIELNHRYALDGSDPNSYGGILWCLGLFDRPFQPEEPIFGLVRTRPTTEHAQRLGLAAYQSRVARPARSDRMKVAVVGAGISGLFAARVLMDHGIDVQIYEKSRGTGGRLATRRVDGLAFDIGAQYLTTGDERFGRYVDSWLVDGFVQLWHGRIAALEGREIRAKDNSLKRYVGVPGMTAISRHLAEDLPIAFKTRIIKVSRNGSGWQLTAEAGVASTCYDAVILAIPPAQAAPLLATAPRLADQAASVHCQPCWSLLAAFDQKLPLAFDGVFLNSPVLAWAARNSSKPGRASKENWVIHASADWSRRHLEDDASAVVAPLLGEFFTMVEVQPCQPVFIQAHRWRYAKANAPLTVGCLWDSTLCLGACGDWCAGSRIEGAALSGMAIAGRVMGLPERNPGMSS